MKKKNHIIIAIIYLPFLFLVFSSCSSRNNIPILNSDSTIIYTPKNTNDISVNIKLYRKTGSKSGKLIDEGTVFTIKENRNVRARVDVENPNNNSKELMFHVDWIDLHGKSVHRKQVDLIPDDSSSFITSSISISPDKRLQGKYIIRIYLFRELIAEKKFELLPESDNNMIVNSITKANIAYYGNKNKATGKLTDEDTVFIINKKRSVYAIVDIEMDLDSEKEELPFQLIWIGPDNHTIYNKQIDIFSNDYIFELASSISISPKKRIPGIYTLQVSLFGNKIAEKNFELVEKSF
ncbi:MAG: hypothetical protein HQ521_05765 [Bacteroidetes bacterium]|nr:hypothetical protein [Bacteroidota bacterium]